MGRMLRAVVCVFSIVACLSVAVGSAEAQILERQVLVQGSVGQLGREVAFLNMQALDQVGVTLTVMYVPEGANAQPIVRSYELAPEQRFSVNIGQDVPELGARANFSVIAVAEAHDGQPAAVELEVTWYRRPDLREVETRRLATRRSPKR